MNDYETKIYPNLNVPTGGSNFRLTKSCEVLARLENEEKHYENMRKKYVRARNTLQNISVTSGSLSVLLSMSGLGTSLSGFGIVVGLPLGVVGGFCGILSVLTGTYSKRVVNKISKHEQTATVARAKVNTIKDLISKAIRDEKISDEEFSLILKEKDKFEDLKLGIRKRFSWGVDEKNDIDMVSLRTKIQQDLIKKIDTKCSPGLLRLSCICDLKIYFTGKNE